jgi:hypothetical protein
MPAGLLNGNNLRALTERGYVAACGDNTWGDLYLNLNNPYQMLRTTAAGSNFPGFLIIPRWVTQSSHHVHTCTGLQLARISLYGWCLLHLGDNCSMNGAALAF